MFGENPETFILMAFCSFHLLGWCILFHLFLEVCSVTCSPPKNSGKSLTDVFFVNETLALVSLIYGSRRWELCDFNIISGR